MKRQMSVVALMGFVALGLCAPVNADSHDVEWTFGNVGSSSYRLDGFSPDDAGLGANLGTQDPTLTVHIGSRCGTSLTIISMQNSR